MVQQKLYNSSVLFNILFYAIMNAGDVFEVTNLEKNLTKNHFFPPFRPNSFYRGRNQLKLLNKNHQMDSVPIKKSCSI